MAARGSIVKQEIAQKILNTFPGSFLYNDGKEIRINGIEEGVAVQIKVTLTATKVPITLENSEEEFNINNKEDISINTDFTTVTEKIPQEPSDEEKARLTELLEKLGL